MRLKRWLAAALVLTLAPGAVAAGSVRASDDTSPSYSLSEYENNEVLAVYEDGSTAVFSYGSQAELQAGLGALAAQSDILWLQPNFTYGNTGLEDGEPLYAQQWALFNDGTFVMQEAENEFPVFEGPFRTPAAPGQWAPPGGHEADAGRTFSRQAERTASSVTAVSGIDINAGEAWDIYDGGSREVVVALIDTGVDITHEDLADSIWINEDEIAGNGIDDDRNGYIDDVNGWNFRDDCSEVCTGSEDDHGTHGAGTIAASSGNGTGVAGIAGDTENVEIMVLKALGGPDGNGTTQDVIEAIRYAESNGASIVNLSLGSSTFDYALYLVMKSSDLLFVVAAGNDGGDSDETGSYPAAYDLDNIISVANLQCDGTLSETSNYGETSVDLAAPGTYILSTTTGDTYSYMSGTSMAAPMVTAVAAMVYSYYDDVTLPEVRQIILGSARELNALDGLVATGGMLDAGAALSYDLTALEDTAFNADADTGTGSAPVITFEAAAEGGGNYLTLTVTDADGDLCLLCYAQGELTAEDFLFGAAGTQVSLSGSETVTFRIVRGGTYTFYALDQAGNETVEVVDVTAADASGTGPGDGAPHMPPAGAPRQNNRRT